ncbi:MAG TPA: phospholipid carrier-dependent glycosyltransferase [Candidatus Dormibacteraeota bacterium]|nr:phospholipid carrier-dependent glycosyltransferase [Candidatus Dormibacteraeota bacterium]
MANAEEGSSRPYALVERAGALAVRVREWLRRPYAPLVLLGVVSLFSLGARVLWLANPNSALIFDEAYYVNAARVIIGIHPPAGANYASAALGVDPNQEHPPLGKLFVVAGMRMFGDNPLGWRFFSLVFGSLAILLMFWLVRQAGGGRWLALGAATLMAVDNLSLVHGRIATLDVFAVVFMLAAAVFYLRGWWILAALATGLGLAVKLYTGEILLVLLLFEMLMLRPPGATLGTLIVRFAKYAGLAVVAYVVALAVFDGAMHTGTNPLRHTLDMIGYAGNLKSTGGPVGIASYPWEWLLNQTPINYFTVNTDVYVGGKLIVSHPVVAFQGLMNPFIIFLALPAFALAVRLAGRERDRVAALSVAWILATFVPFVIMAVFLQRTEYLYYMLVVLPGIYIAVARLFSRRFLPRSALVGYVCALGYGFWSLYPFRTFRGY